MKCYKCHQTIEETTSGKIPFRAICSKCQAYLHCCFGCKFFKVGMYNDCMVPGTERVVDKGGMNFCEDFLYGEKLNKEDSSNAKKRFDDLFK